MKMNIHLYIYIHTYIWYCKYIYTYVYSYGHTKPHCVREREHIIKCQTTTTWGGFAKPWKQSSPSLLGCTFTQVWCILRHLPDKQPISPGDGVESEIWQCWARQTTLWSVMFVDVWHTVCASLSEPMYICSVYTYTFWCFWYFRPRESNWVNLRSIWSHA